MISRELFRAGIDKVKSEHSELLYGIIRLLVDGASTAEASPPLDWHDLVASVLGSLAPTRSPGDLPYGPGGKRPAIESAVKRAADRGRFCTRGCQSERRHYHGNRDTVPFHH